MVTVISILTVSAFVVTLVSAMGRAPIWVAVLLLCLVELLRVLPLGR